MTTGAPLDFATDQPLTSTQDDCLNRAQFAKRISGVLLGLPRGSGLVVGIHGPWGDGKTTVLNMIRADLEASDGMVVVEFNPWRFTDETAMLAGFFGVLAGTIRAKLTTKGEDIAGWIEKIGRYAAVIDDRFSVASEIAAANAEASLEEMRRRLCDALAKADKRIVILIDDIDRLDKHETHTLFRLIKACADFPNVCYVLAFDDAAVAKALGDRYGGGDEKSGRAFLEKIIQVPLNLPVAAKEDLRSMCFEHVDRALMAAGMELTREQVGEFVSGFDKGVSIRLNTPRAAKRYGNGLLFALPMLKGETNPVDLLLAEALRAFFPEIYNIVRDNYMHFSNLECGAYLRSADRDRAAELIDPILDAMPREHADAVKALLIDLFPRIESIYGNVRYDSSCLLRWSREKRISSPYYCARYFMYAVPRDDVPDAVITELFDLATKQETAQVETYVKRNLAGPKAHRLIEKLRAIEETIEPVAAELLATAMARFGKNIPNPQTLFSFADPPSQAAILISHLLRRIPDRAKRTAAAKRVMEVADPLWFGAGCLRWLYVTDKPEKQGSNTLTKVEEEAVRKVLVERIKVLATAGAPLFDPDLRHEQDLLFEWWRAEGREPVQAHLLSVFNNEPTQIARFLQSMAPLSWGADNVLPRVSELDADQLKNIKLIIDLDVMAEWIRGHCPGDFDNCPGDFDNPTWFPDETKPLEQRLAEQFMFVYNKWKAEGEPDDSSRSPGSIEVGRV